MNGKTNSFTTTNLSYIERALALFQALRTFVSSWPKHIDWNKLGSDVLYILLMIWKHGIVIILMLIPIILLIKLPQGKDLMNNLLFPGNWKTFGSYLLILWFLSMIIFTTYALWAIPGFYQNIEARRLTSNEEKKSLISIKSASSLFIRILSMTPFVFYGIVIFVLEKRCFTHWALYWLIILIAGLFIITLCFHLYYRQVSFRNLILLGVVTCLVVTVCYPLLYKLVGHKEFSILLLGNALLFLGGLTYLMYKAWEDGFKALNLNPSNRKSMQNKGDRLYYILMALSLLVMISFSFVTNMMYISTVCLLTMVMGCLILWFNLFIYFYKSKAGGVQFLLFAAVVGIIVLVHVPESKPHRVFLVEKSKLGDRISLDEYMNKWLEKHVSHSSPEDTLVEPIYLIAGEGGGSRGGLWYATFIQTMDSLTNGTFSKRTFATSTVSGSSVGASLLTKWYRVAKDLGLDRVKDQRAQTMAKLFFSNNFTAGAVFDLFYLDFVRRFKLYPTRSGRNLRLQEEENAAFIKAMHGDSAVFCDMFSSIPGGPNSSSIELIGKDIPNYHFLPIQDVWKDSNNQPILDIPLNFFNTTEMSTGRQMAIAPVSFSFDPTGIFAKDLISYTQNQNCWFKEKHDIALGTANNLSELFPFFSAYTHIDGVGHFMDGGGNDNSGTKTLKFIYQKISDALDSKFADDTSKRPPVVVIYISNSNPDGKNVENKRKKAKSQVVALFTQVGAQPFEMITKEAIEDLKKEVSKQDQDYFIEASWSSFNKYTDCPENCEKLQQKQFPTARSLTRDNIKEIIHYSKKKAHSVYDSLKVIPR
ncbi:MAG TPA: hypothetical protein PLC76_10525 [Saprospiraceae bacterium]|nr:hypothetical protein [Saprospiraceae bacterium]HRP85147.1 hypothetical protein [Saprospiraceae bacterium]